MRKNIIPSGALLLVILMTVVFASLAQTSPSPPTQPQKPVHTLPAIPRPPIPGPAAPVNPSLTVAIGNFCSLDAALLEQVRAYAEAQLHVQVRAFDAKDVSLSDLKKQGPDLAKYKSTNDVCLVALVAPQGDVQLHACYFTNVNVTVVNVLPIRSDDPVKRLRRLEKQVMRGAAFMFGLTPDPDPHCVTHDYVTLDDLDKLGANFSPPWLDLFVKLAQAKGMKTSPLLPTREEILKRRAQRDAKPAK